MIKLPLDNKNRVNILQHDVEMHEYTPLDDNGAVTPFAWSLLIHIGIIGFFVMGNLQPDMEKQPFVETTLITTDQLDTIRSQVLANRSQAAKSNTNDPNTPSQAISASSASNQSATTNTNKPNTNNQKNQMVSSTSAQTKTAKSRTEVTQKVEVTLPDKTAKDTPVFEKSPETIAYEKKIAEKKKQHHTAMKAFETEAERTAQAKLKANVEAEEKRRQEVREKVIEYKEAELEAPKKEDENKLALEQAAAEQAKNRRKSERERDKSISSSLVASGAAELASNQLINSGVSGSANISTGSIVTQTSYANMANHKIRNRLVPPIGSGHDSTDLEITVDATGRVIRASASGTNPALNRAAEQAARSASPLPIKIGDKDYPTWRLGLNGRGNK